MKVLIGSKFDMVGGIENYVEEVSRRIKYKFDLEVLAANKKFMFFRAPFTFSYFKILFSKYDLLFVQSPNPFVEFLSLFINKPVIITHHNDVVRYPFLRWFYLNLILYPAYKNSKYIISTSEPYIKYSNILAKFKDKVVVIPNCVDSKFYQPISVKKPKIPYFIFVGRLVNYKGIDILLKAFKIVSKSYDVGLKIVGEGNLKTELIDLNDSLKNRNVEFLGSISEDQKKLVVSGSSGLILPSRTTQEGFGLVLIEAMAMGVPVIGTRISAMPWIIKDGVTGFNFELENELDLAEKMIKLLNTNKDNIMGIAARKDVLNRFDWDVIVDSKLVPLFNKVIKND